MDRFDFVKTVWKSAAAAADWSPEMSQLFAPKIPEWPKFRGPQKVETSRVWTCFCFTKAGMEARYARGWSTRDVRSLGTLASGVARGQGPRPNFEHLWCLDRFCVAKPVWKSRFCRIATGWDWAQFWALGRYAGPKTGQAEARDAQTFPLANIRSGRRFSKGKV